MYVYVAGPYTRGDQATNTRKAILAGEELAEAGHVPFVPHLYHFWHFLSPKPYEFWMDLDLAWLEQCKALIRLNGFSPGGDTEVERAQVLGIPVYESVADFLAAQ